MELGRFRGLPDRAPRLTPNVTTPPRVRAGRDARAPGNAWSRRKRQV